MGPVPAQSHSRGKVPKPGNPFPGEIARASRRDSLQSARCQPPALNKATPWGIQINSMTLRFNSLFGRAHRKSRQEGGAARSLPWGIRLMGAGMAGALVACGPTSPQPDIPAGQRRCVIYHPYYYNGDKRPDEVETRNTLTVQVGGREKYSLRPYRSLQVPIPREGTRIEVLDTPWARVGYGHRSEIARVPAGGETAYVRISRSQLIGLNTYLTDRARLVSPAVAKKEIAEFE
jgi:hypothetical protein